jgi:hypothetical protein
MKDHHVQYQVSGPPSQTASANYVPNSAAWEIRKNGFAFGMIFGIVVALVAIVLTAKQPPGSAPGTPPTRSQEQEIGGRGRTADVPSGPRLTPEYAFAIDKDSYLPVRRELGKPVKNGTVIDNCFYITKRVPSRTAFSLPEDINATWESPLVYSPTLKKPVPFQLRNGDWWSEASAEYVAFNSEAKPMRYTWDDVHSVSVPLMTLTTAEMNAVKDQPLKALYGHLCLSYGSSGGFVPIHHPSESGALWDASTSAYLTTEGRKIPVDKIYGEPPRPVQTKETKE